MRRAVTTILTFGAVALILSTAAAAGAAQDLIPVEYRLQVAADAAPVRAEAREDSAELISLAKGTMLASYLRTGQWFRVAVEAGEGGILVVGYVAAADVQVVKAMERTPPNFWAVESGEYRGIGLSVRIIVGLNNLGGGDLRAGSLGMFDGAGANLQSIGYSLGAERRDFSWTGAEAGVDFTFRLTPRLRVGAGIESCFENSKSWQEYSRWGIDFLMTLQTHISYLAPRLSVIYTLPLNDLLALYAEGGVWRPVVNYTNTIEGWQTESLNVKSRALGYHGGIGFEVTLTSRGYFFVEARGRYGRLTAFRGRSSLEIQQPWMLPKTSVKEGRLMFLDDGTQKTLVIRPTEEDPVEGSREAILPLKSFGISTGLRVKF